MKRLVLPTARLLTIMTGAFALFSGLSAKCQSPKRSSGIIFSTETNPVTIHFLNKIREIESSGGKFLIGDNGKARGPFQFHAIAWQQVTELRKRRGLSSTSWKTGAMTEYWSRIYAKDYADWLADQLLKELGWCSERSIYAAWNAGLSRVLAVNGDLYRLNRLTVSKCAQLDAARFAVR